MIDGWKYFEIGDIFPDIYKAVAYNAQDLSCDNAVDCDTIRYVTRTDINNGCKEFVKNDNFKHIEDGNAITIGDTTATCYYQSEPFICGDTLLFYEPHFLMKLEGFL